MSQQQKSTLDPPAVASDKQTRRKKKTKLGGRTVQLRMWDTGGMERFEAMNLASNFYRNAHGVMLVFSVTDLASFESLPSLVGRARSPASAAVAQPAKVASSNAAWLQQGR
uniref:Small GTPase superfamily n=1 Tax=Macrostomum lignano TaxID=282301 RepID=A0A1I8F5C1_9PLAT